jgi:hypothetical protein
MTSSAVSDGQAILNASIMHDLSSREGDLAYVTVVKSIRSA